MKPARPLLALALAAVPALAAQGQPAVPLPRAYQAAADRIIAAATADSAAWNKLAELTDTFGHRLSGSEALERAIDWIIERMKAEGLQNVRGEPVKVPRWVRGVERAELHLDQRSRAAGVVHRRLQTDGRLPLAEREDQRHRALRGTAHQERDQLDRPLVGPVKVVERDDESLTRCQQLEQRPGRGVGLEALVLQPGRAVAGQPLERREQLGQLGQTGVAQRLQAAALQAGQVVVESVHEGPEGELALELRAPPAQGQHAVALGHAAELVQQGGLADSGFPADGDQRRAPVGVAERSLDPLQLGPATDQCLALIQVLSALRE